MGGVRRGLWRCGTLRSKQGDVHDSVGWERHIATVPTTPKPGSGRPHVRQGKQRNLRTRFLPISNCSCLMSESCSPLLPSGTSPSSGCGCCGPLPAARPATRRRREGGRGGAAQAAAGVRPLQLAALCAWQRARWAAVSACIGVQTAIECCEVLHGCSEPAEKVQALGRFRWISHKGPGAKGRQSTTGQLSRNQDA